MSKVGDARALPEVADKGSDDASQIYDFLQSDDWQKTLEKARIQRERHLSARGGGGKEKPASKPARQNTSHSTGRDHPPGSKHLWDRLDEARQQRKAVLARRSAEGEERDESESDTSVRKKSDEGSSGKSDAPAKAIRKKDISPGAPQKTHPQDAPDNKMYPADESAVNMPVDQVSWSGDIPAEETKSDGSRTDQGHSGSGAGIPVEDVNRQLRRKMLRSWVKRQQAPGTRFGAVALGCVIGVIASSLLFFALFFWGSRPTQESVDSARSGVEPIGMATSRGADAAPPEAGQSGGSASVNSSEVGPPISPVSALAESDVAETESSTVVAASHPLPDAAEGTVPKQLTTLTIAPAVRFDLSSLEQPQFPVAVSAGRSRPEAAPALVLQHRSQEFPGTPIASLGEAAIKADLSDILAAVGAPLPRAPTIDFQPALMTSGAEYTPSTKLGLAYFPSPQPAYATAVNPGSPNTVILASLDFLEPPVVPYSNVPIRSSLTNLDEQTLETEAVSRFLQDELPNLLPQGSDPADLTSDTASPEDDAERGGSVTESTGADYRLFVPNGLAAGSAESVVKDLVASGHQLSGTARVAFGVKRSNVRFYHKQDAAQAAALAKDADAVLRDFTGSRSKTTAGVIELWLAGESAPEPIAETARDSAFSDSQIDQLTRQVLEKLRSTVNQ